MHDPSATAGTSVPAPPPLRRSPRLARRPSAADEPERDRLLEQARETDAGRQLRRCFAALDARSDHLRLAGARRLADNQPVDPNDPDAWRSRDEHAQAVLRRHGIGSAQRRRG